MFELQRKRGKGATGYWLLKRMPTAEDPSHAGISGYENNNLTVRLALAQLVTSGDAYPALTSA